MRLLILNCYSRNSLAIIKALDPKIEIIGGAIDRNSYFLVKPDTVFRHKRVKQIIRHCNPLENLDKFKGEIIKTCNDFKIDGIMASGTSMTNSLSICKPDIEKNTKAIAVVERYSKLKHLADKWLMYKVAVKLRINTPFTILLDGSNRMWSYIEKLKFPVVIKPRLSYAAIGLNTFETRKEMENWIGKFPEKLDGSHIAQEHIQGALHDVTCCAQNGVAVSLLTQKRVKTLYDFGGGGIINMTTDEPEPKNYVKLILKRLRWNGAAEFDFIRTNDGKYYLLECNPKIWGTTYLSVAAGVNIPQQAVDVFFKKKTVPRIEEYEVGLMYKWIFPECVFNWFQRPRSIGNIRRRVRETFKCKGTSRTIYNLNLVDFPHILGTVFDKTFY